MEFAIASTVLSAGGSIVSGIQQQQAAEDQADHVMKAAQLNEQIRKGQARKAIGRQIAEAGAGGGITGSAFEVIANSAVESDYQGQIDLYNAANRAEALRVGGSHALSQGIFGAIATAGQGAFLASQSSKAERADTQGPSEKSDPPNKFDDIRKTRVDRTKGSNSLYYGTK